MGQLRGQARDQLCGPHRCQLGDPLRCPLRDQLRADNLARSGGDGGEERQIKRAVPFQRRPLRCIRILLETVS
ncbi:MAG: hypothetical protein MZV63_42515 [Marinilabiliales bacterium]|nr:hypothetical protein [Marinilabiliales bacterium]